MLADPGMDHLAYTMFNGLYKILGKENLSIYPYVKHYHGGIDEYILDNGQKWYSVPPPHISRHETLERSFDELVNGIHSFDIIYLSSGRTYAVNALNQFITRLGRHNLPPIIFSEGEDYYELITIRDIKKRYNPVVCFKRELLQSDLDNNPDLYPLYPLPFSAILDKMPQDNPNKDIDIFALFGNTYPLRENIVKTISSSYLPSKYKININIDHFSNEPKKIEWHDQSRFNIPPLVPYLNYLDLMSRSKINIIARGWGYDTLRRFEAPCFSGLVMSDNLPITTPNPFIDNVHIIYYDNELGDLISRIEYLLNADNERRRVGIEGRDHCMKYHTTDARARYFIHKVEQHI